MRLIAEAVVVRSDHNCVCGRLIRCPHNEFNSHNLAFVQVVVRQIERAALEFLHIVQHFGERKLGIQVKVIEQVYNCVRVHIVRIEERDPAVIAICAEQAEGFSDKSIIESDTIVTTPICISARLIGSNLIRRKFIHIFNFFHYLSCFLERVRIVNRHVKHRLEIIHSRLRQRRTFSREGTEVILSRINNHSLIRGLIGRPHDQVHYHLSAAIRIRQIEYAAIE